MSNKVKYHRFLLSGIFWPASLCAGIAHAQTVQLPSAALSDEGSPAEIIVTGMKFGAQSLQKTPVAISVVGEDLIREQGLSTVQDLASYVPNLTFQRNANQAIVYLRGIGSTNASAGSDPSVTQQVDGVYIARPTGQIGDFLDVARIEVLRGPQGTLYGRNAVGGAINIVSSEPSSTLHGRFRIGYGNYDTKTVEAYLTGPLAGDALTASIAGTYRQNDGYFNNIVPGGHDVGSAKRAGVRGQIRWQPSPDLDVTLRADYSSMHDYLESYDHLLDEYPAAPLASGLMGGYDNVAINTDQKLIGKMGGVSLTADYRMGDHFTLKSITAWRKLHTNTFNDSDGTELAIQSLEIDERQQQFTQEFNLNYDSDRLKGVLGLYFFGDKDTQVNQAIIPPSVANPPNRSSIRTASPNIKTRSYAMFGQGSYEFFDGLKATVGLRYTYETKDLVQYQTRTSLNPVTPGVMFPGFPLAFATDRSDDAVTSKFGLDYQAMPDVMLYASATQGFKSGGFNNGAIDAGTAGFSPEKLWAYEVGAKTELFDRMLRFNVSGFIYDYKDMQVRYLLSPGNAVIVNAASAKIKGFEVESVLQPAPAVSITANLAYLDAKFKDFPVASIASAYASYISDQTCAGTGASVVCSFDASGNRLESTPRWSGLIGLDLTPNLVEGYRANLHVDYAWRGAAYFDASNIEISKQSGYGLLNANVGFGPENGWRIEAYVRNATNKNYYQVIAGSGLVPAGIAGDPRTYGIRFGYSF